MAYTMLGIHYIMPKTFYAYLTFMVSLITIFSIYVAPYMHINDITWMPTPVMYWYVYTAKLEVQKIVSRHICYTN